MGDELDAPTVYRSCYLCGSRCLAGLDKRDEPVVESTGAGGSVHSLDTFPAVHQELVGKNRLTSDTYFWR